ncbi:hypothetical protein ES705_44522 [subsurface metagenome]
MGTFTTNKELPEINDNRICYEIGLFQETLLKFLQRVDLKKTVIIHLDADLYSSTLFVLTSLISILPKGTIVIFDEFAGRCGTHEFRAFIDVMSSYNRKYLILGTTYNFMHLAFKLL